MKNRNMWLYGAVKVIHSVSKYLELVCYYLFLDAVIMKKQMKLLFPIVGAYIGCYLVETLLCVIERCAYNHIFPAMVLQTKKTIMDKYERLDVGLIRDYAASDLKARLNDDTENFAQYYVKKIDICVGVINTVIVLCILFYFNVYLTLFCLVMLPISFYITKNISSRNNMAYMDLRNEQVNSDNFSYNIIQSWKEIRLNGVINTICDEYNSFCNRIGKLYVKTHILWFLNRTFIAFKDAFVTKMSIYFVGGILILKGYTNVSVLLVFMQFYENLISTIVGIGDLKVSIGREKESISKIENILAIENCEKVVPVNPTIEVIELENINFSYDSQLVLKNICLEIEKGKKIGIVGKSGCGKSTLLKLMVGINNIDAGKILIDGVEINKIDMKYLYNKIGIIMQDSYLFNLSIKDNLLFGKEMATDDEIEQACKKAQIHDYIMSLEDNYHTVIGENGVRLSGGQRQRLVIARMLLHNPDIIFFDEATSALDSENEAEIIKEIMGYTSDKTFVIVAHDLDTITNCDYLYFIENGNIEDKGTHSELLNRNMSYRRLWGVQYDK